MSAQDWPTFAEVETLAQKAHFDGFHLKMDETDAGWQWIWLHDTGMYFEGSCDSPSRIVSLVCALMSVPVVITVDSNGEATPI